MGNPMPQNQDWQTIREISTKCYVDGIDVLATIETLERGNEAKVIAAVDSAGANSAAAMIRKALFFKLHIIVIRAYDAPKRIDDSNTAVAIGLINKPGIIDMADRPEQRAELKDASSLFSELAKHRVQKRLRNLRSKHSVHVTNADVSLASAQIQELFWFARETAKVWELLAAGAGVVTVPLEYQVDAYRESADAFWSPWDGAPG